MPQLIERALPPPCQTYFVIGESRTNSDNAITQIYGSFYLAFEVDGKTDEVLAFNCTHTLEITERFLQRLFVGRNFLDIDLWLERELERCYGGSSRKAVLVSYRDALKRYRAMRRGGAS
jgi:beta-lactamase class A